MSKETPPEEKIRQYDELVSHFPDIPRKGKKVPYTSINGHMFSYLGLDGTLALRLEKEEREKFLVEHETELDVQYGSVMKEYVRVPAGLQDDLDKMKKYFALSLDYAKSLKPK